MYKYCINLIIKLDKDVVSPSPIGGKKSNAPQQVTSTCEAGEVAKRLKPRLPAPPVAGCSPGNTCENSLTWAMC